MSQKFPVDVKQFADLFNCEESTAYGVLRFLAEKNILPTTKRPQPQGKKGKPATIFMVDINDLPRALGDVLSKGFERLKNESAAIPAANDNHFEEVQAISAEPTDVA